MIDAGVRGSGRCLFLSSDLGMGGIQRNMQQLALAIHEWGGWEVAVLGLREDEERGARLREAGIVVWTGERGVEQALQWAPEVVNVHTHGFRDERLAGALKELQGAGAAVIETNSFARPNDALEAGVVQLRILKSLWCQWEWESVTAHVRPPPVSVVVPNLVDEEAFKPTAPAGRVVERKTLGIPPDAVVLGWISQPYSKRWSAHAIHAFRELAQERPALWMIAVGLSERLESEVERFPNAIRRRVISLPTVEGDERLRRLYGAMDVFVHSSRIGDSFGYVLAEAQTCGLPVVTLATPHRTNAQVEVAAHGQGGLVANDEASFTEAVRALVDDQEFRRELGDKARARARRLYGTATVIPQILAVLEYAAEYRGRAEAWLPHAIEDALGLQTSTPASEIARLVRTSLGAPNIGAVAAVRLRTGISRVLSRFPPLFARWNYRGWSIAFCKVSGHPGDTSAW
jgi:glycosyltransferase involved in cell wall biosynthesis